MKDHELSHEQALQHLQQIKLGSVAMLVLVRVRPSTPKQLTQQTSKAVKVIDHQLLTLIDSNQESQRKNRIKQTQFTFDFVYNDTITTKEIYDQSLSNFIDGILQGYNSTIIAYGATGCGKTYTMIGEQGKEGIIALAMIDLLGRANEQRKMKNIVIRVSYIEIYNESIKDLLISQDKNLELREDPKEGIQISGVTEIAISTMLELSTVLKVGAVNRSKQATASNEASSRSHAILMVRAESKDKVQGLKQDSNIGKLSLVDLAGSQKSAQKGNRQLQGAKINRSLLALGNCIQVLADISQKNHFVPYRESKLTRLLKQSLGGNCRTAMIVNISPSFQNWEQTYNSLLYANRAKNIKTTASKTIISAQAHVSNYMSLITNLKRENDELKKQLKGAKNYSLPVLKNNSIMDGNDRLEMQRVQNKIDGHFSQELKLVQAISQIGVKLDKSAFKMYLIHVEQKNEEKSRKSNNSKTEKSQKIEAKLNKVIQQLSQQKHHLQTKLQQLIFQRGTLVNQIKTSDLSQNTIAILISHYRQKKIQMELQEIKLRQHRVTVESEQKQKLMSAIGEQLKLRDKIIEEQRVIIQKNNIINRITYSKIGSIGNNLFNDVFQSLKQAQKKIIPPLKTLEPSFFEQKVQKKQKLSSQNSTKIQKLKSIRRKNQSGFDKQSLQVQWARVKHTQSDKNLLKLQSKNNNLLKQKKKIVRSKSKKKNEPFDLVYLQR